MMEFDAGVFQPTTHQPKHVTLSTAHQAKMVHTGDIVINMMTSECVIVSQHHHESILLIIIRILRLTQHTSMPIILSIG